MTCFDKKKCSGRYSVENYCETSILELIKHFCMDMNEVYDMATAALDFMESLEDIVSPQVKDTLNKMLEDGRLAHLINDIMLGGINTKVDNITNVTKNYRYLVASHGNDGREFLNLYVTDDFINMKKLNVSKLFPGAVRDPQLFYKDGVWYCSYTKDVNRGFGIAVSKDLVNWDLKFINISGYDEIWAPEIFDYFGQTYVTFAAHSGGQTEVDVDGATIHYFTSYHTTIDLDNFTIGTPWNTNFERHNNRIDSDYFYHDSVLYCATKNENTKQIDLYKCYSWDNTPMQYITTINYPLHLEGPTLTHDGTKFHLLADAFQQGALVHFTSSDCATWSSGEIVNSKDMISHPSILKLEDSAMPAVNSFYGTQLGQVAADSNRVDDRRQMLISIDKLMSGTELNVPIEDCYISVSGGQKFVVNKINGNVLRFYIVCLFPKNNDAYLRFEMLNNVVTPNDRDLILNGYHGYAETIIEVNRIFGEYRFKVANQFGYRNLVDLNGLATGGVIDTLTIHNNTTYFVDGNSHVTINHIQYGDHEGLEPFSVFFSVYSVNAPSGIVIKQSNGVLVTPKGADLTLTGPLNGDIVYEFMSTAYSYPAGPLRIRGGM